MTVQAQFENDHDDRGWTAADDAAYREWLDSTLEGQQELEDLYWQARAAAEEKGEEF